MSGQIFLDSSDVTWRDDWLACTMPAHLGETITELSAALGCSINEWREVGHGGQGYRHLMVGPLGSRLYWGAVDQDTGLERGDLHFVLPGQACSTVSWSAMLSLLRFVKARGGHPTRLDIALDDFAKRISPSEFLAHIQSAECVTHARMWRHLYSGAPGSADVTGDTVYLGAPGSRQQLRVYDKEQESDGAIKSIRFELQTRDEVAAALMNELLAAGEDGHLVGQVMAARLASFVDFRYESDDQHHTERRVRCQWWADLLRDVGRAATYVLEAAKTIEDKERWIEKGVSTTLALLMRWWEGDVSKLYAIIKDGDRRLKPKHLALLSR